MSMSLMTTSKSKGILKSPEDDETGQKEKYQVAISVLLRTQTLTWINPINLHAPEIEVQSVRLSVKSLPEGNSETSRLLTR